MSRACVSRSARLWDSLEQQHGEYSLSLGTRLLQPCQSPDCWRRTGLSATSVTLMAGAARARDRRCGPCKGPRPGTRWNCEAARWWLHRVPPQPRRAGSLWGASSWATGGRPGREDTWRGGRSQALGARSGAGCFLTGKVTSYSFHGVAHRRGRATLVRGLHRGPPCRSVPIWSAAWECPDTRPLPRLWLVRGPGAFFSPGCGKSMPLFCMATNGGASGGAPRR